jgi:hypothetical protein
MKTIVAIFIACLFFTSPLLAEPPKAPEGPVSLSYLTSQAQKIKTGYTKEAEVIELLGQPQSKITKDKTIASLRKMGHSEVKIFKYGPNKNIIIHITDGVVSRVDTP